MQKLEEMVVLVDENDREIGEEKKLNAHIGRGKLHRGFVIFLFNSEGRLLVQKRSKDKLTWPNYWDGTSSHPRLNESYEEAGKRRLKEELGISAELKKVFTFEYHERYGNSDYSEWEICALLVGHSNELPVPNADEVSELKYVSLGELKKDIDQNPYNYTPWFKIAFDRYWEG